jgi:hypothetical protein
MTTALQSGLLRAIVAATIVMAVIIPLASIGNAREATSGYTPRGYRYDNKTCSSGFNTCRESHLQMGWQTGAASSYCSQACGVFPPQSFDRHSGGNW